MQEKNLSMNDAFQIWWTIIWKTFLVALGVSIALTIFIKAAHLEAFLSIGQLFMFAISIVIQVFFIKSAVNKNYKNFRLSATLLNNENKY